MQPTVSTCRAQEALQRRIASEALLPNARRIATIAAAAWETEAVAAERREARQAETRRQTASKAPTLRVLP